MLMPVFLFAVLFSVTARIAVNEDDLPDISSNLIDHKDDDITETNANSSQATERTDKDNKTVISSTTESNNSTDFVNVYESGVIFKIPESDFVLRLTPYVRIQNAPELARNLSRVNPKIFAGLESYSGYFTVNEFHNSNMFFWYFPIEKGSVEETPWILWLQGGPGASSLTGLFDELGPLAFDKDMNLIKHPYSWLQNHSLVFFDNPVGTGFSFTSLNGYVTDMETYTKQLHDALMQLLDVFPDLRKAPLYIAGESYAGKYVPALALEVHRRKNERGMNVNLQGILLGNAYVDPSQLQDAAAPFLNNGLLDSKQVELLKPMVDQFNNNVAANNSVLAKDSWTKLLGLLLSLSNQSTAYNFLTDRLSIGRYMVFLEQPQVRRALHVGRTPFYIVNMHANIKLAPDFLSSTKPIIEQLLEHYRVMTYCGQLDMMLPCAVSSLHHHTWRWSRSQQFHEALRTAVYYNNTLAGYQKSGGGLTEALVRGAGHMVALDRPAPARALITAFTHPTATAAPPNNI